MKKIKRLKKTTFAALPASPLRISSYAFLAVESRSMRWTGRMLGPAGSEDSPLRQPRASSAAFFPMARIVYPEIFGSPSNNGDEGRKGTG